MSPKKETFHVVIRIPTQRPKGFVEPPSIIWTDEMEHKLWQYMSQKNTDWNEIAEQLGVPTSYIVRHAAFIYETQLRGIHQQLRLNTNNTSMSRNTAKSPTPSLKRPSSIRYSNTFQQQYQMTPQEAEQSTLPQKPITPQELNMTRNDPMMASNISNNTILRTAANETPTQQTVRSHSSHSLYKSSSSQVTNDNQYTIGDGTEDDNDNQAENRDAEEEEEEEEDQNDGTEGEEEEDEEEEFSSHFERMKLQVEEPAFLPRRLSGSHSNLSASRQHLSLSIQNLRKPSNAYIPEVVTSPMAGPSGTAAVKTGASPSLSANGSPKKILSPQSHSPAIRPSTTVVPGSGGGSKNNSAINSSTSSISDISESSVTQSAMEDAFLSNFNHGSKMSLMSFSRKNKE